MVTFEIGMEVQTNDEYFRMYGRRVFGEVVDTGMQPPPQITMIRVTRQEGNAIPEHSGKILMMRTVDLKIRYMQ